MSMTLKKLFFHTSHVLLFGGHRNFFEKFNWYVITEWHDTLRWRYKFKPQFIISSRYKTPSLSSLSVFKHFSCILRQFARDCTRTEERKSFARSQSPDLLCLCWMFKNFARLLFVSNQHRWFKKMLCKRKWDGESEKENIYRHF